MEFKEIGLNKDLEKALSDLGFIEPSAIQAEAIPFILQSQDDLIALAQTGTGKTAAFGLPILHQLKQNQKNTQALVICPTRELGIQIADDLKKFAKYQPSVRIVTVYGGERIDIQLKALRRGADIVVGTPGRIKDLIKRRALRLQAIDYLVLDEADEMLDMGFKDDLDFILDTTPSTRQTLLFSATMVASVNKIAKHYMRDAQEIRIGSKNSGAENVSHEYYLVRAQDRFEALQRILDSLFDVYGIIFCRTRRETQDVADKLKQAGYDAEALHGEITQTSRTKIMTRFKKKNIRLLVATDVAARGIDVNNLTHIINYNLPDKNESYTHRSGRTGRAKQSGIAISIITARDKRKIRDIEKVIGKEFLFKKIPQGDDIYKKKIADFVERLKNRSEIIDLESKYFQEAIDELKKINKEDLIKLFINEKFAQLIDGYKNARDLNIVLRSGKTRPVDDNYIDLKINIGKKQGLDVKQVFRLINSGRVKGVDIGKIRILPGLSFISVEKDRAEELKNDLQGRAIKGRKIEITLNSKKTTSYSGKYKRKISRRRRSYNNQKKRGRQ